MSIREQILAAPVAAGEKVEVPGWSVTVEVRPLSLRARADVYRTVGETPDLERLYPALIIASTFDPETGGPVFTADDTDWLADQAGPAVELLAAKALELSGLTPKPAAG